MTTKRPRLRNRVPLDQRKKMDLIFRGALAVIAKHKALAEAERKVKKTIPEPQPLSFKLQPRKRRALP
jgi:hypothetical protein